jgi:hypothetical protein
MFVLRVFAKRDRLRAIGLLIIGVKLKAEANFRGVSHVWNVPSESLSRMVLI